MSWPVAFAIVGVSAALVLLKDPQPGLATWRQALSDTIYEIGQYGGQDIIMGKSNPRGKRS